MGFDCAAMRCDSITMGFDGPAMWSEHDTMISGCFAMGLTYAAMTLAYITMGIAPLTMGLEALTMMLAHAAIVLAHFTMS